MAKKKRAKGGRKKTRTTRTSKRDRRPKWVAPFLAALARTGNVSKAVEESGVARSAAYDYRDWHADFAALWDESLKVACDALEMEARRRGVDGVDKPIIYKGELMGVWVNDAGEIVSKDTPEAKQIPLTVKEYSDALLQTLLRAHLPGKYRENVKHDHGGTLHIEHSIDLSKLTDEQLEQLEAIALASEGRDSPREVQTPP